MRLACSLLVLSAGLALSSAAYADTVNAYTVTGTLADGDTFSGVISIDTGAYGESISAMDITTVGDAYAAYTFDAAAGNPLFQNNLNSSGTLYAQVNLTPGTAPYFYLLLDRTAGGFAIDLGSREVDNRNYTQYVTSESVTAITPEPSSLLLLGTGIAGMVAANRRRFLSA